jgi:hypothetical protein
MQVVYGLFKPSRSLELAVEILSGMGLSGGGLLLTPLDAPLPSKQRIIDSMHTTDGMSLVDGMALSATVGMLMGVIYGSVLPIGPVALGLIGLLGGGGTGYLIDRSISPKNRRRRTSMNGFMLVAIRCSEEESLEVKKIMTEHHCSAVGISTLS